ncbi:MAG: ABC transporter ATP-binding protein [Prolixibacteraceae bacterium]
MSILTLEKVSKTYFNESGSKGRMILEELDFQIKKGESIAIIGPSGSGKTTLLNLIGTLDKPDTGQINFDGLETTLLNEKDLAKFRGSKIGFVFQLHHLLPQLSLLENILLPTLSDKIHQGVDSIAHANRLIERLGLSEVASQKPAELSGGECQRTAVARALINQPDLLLADEPTGALDHQSALQLVDLLLEINREKGTTLLVVTHSMEIAQKMDTLYSISKGKLIRLN